MLRTPHRAATPIRSLSVIALALAAALAAAATTAGCDDGFAPGNLTVRIYGEDYIEDDIPADEFVDAWEITFSKFLVTTTGVEGFIEGDDAPATEDPMYRVFDLAQPSGGVGYTVLSTEVPGGQYASFGYRIAAPPAGSSDVVAGNAEDIDVSFMQSNAYAVFVEGLAVKSAETRSFAWGFGATTRYSDCHADVLIDGTDASVQLTIHGDHLFYDDLVSSEPQVAFQLLADADANGDDVIEEAELAAFDISGQERYQTGSLDIDNLYDFIDQQVSTLGHIDGEGHCEGNDRE